MRSGPSYGPGWGEHSDLKGCKQEKSRYQGDRYWFTRRQEANPW
jgi:hypothetical protein